MVAMTRAGAAKASRGVAGSRPMASQFYWALLGLVIKRPGYGYELARRFEAAYGDALSFRADSHIYAGLSRLESRGLIEPTEVTGAPSSRSGSSPRPGYRATERGRQSYRQWLLGRLEDSQRDWMLSVRLLGILTVEPEAALEIIECYRQGLLSQASHVHARRDWASRGESVDEASRLVARLIDEERRLAVGKMIDWVDFAQREFESLAREQT